MKKWKYVGIPIVDSVDCNVYRVDETVKLRKKMKEFVLEWKLLVFLLVHIYMEFSQWLVFTLSMVFTKMKRYYLN